MKIKDVMTRDVQTVRPDQSARSAAIKMAEFDVGSLPVVEEGRLLGQVTDRDIVLKVVAEGMNPDQVAVGDIMTSPALSASQDMALGEAARLMTEHRIRRLIVVDGSKRLSGIIALRDLALQDRREAVTY